MQNIKSIDDGVYYHEVIIHERYFFNPLDVIHTQNAKNLWMSVKTQLRHHYEPKSTIMGLILQNSCLNKENLYPDTLVIIAKFYNI